MASTTAFASHGAIPFAAFTGPPPWFVAKARGQACATCSSVHAEPLAACVACGRRVCAAPACVATHAAHVACVKCALRLPAAAAYPCCGAPECDARLCPRGCGLLDCRCRACSAACARAHAHLAAEAQA